MKLLLEKWREYLSEAELKYSETIFDRIFSFTMKKMPDVIDTGRTFATYESIPAAEVFYSDNKKIANGAVLLMFVVGNKEDPSAATFMTDNWDEESGLPEELINLYLSTLDILEFIFRIDPNIDPSSGGELGWSKDKIFLSLNPALAQRSDHPAELKDTLRHELQHLTQRLNAIALKYGEQLFANNGDVSKIKKIDFDDESLKFGMGKQKTGLRQIDDPEEARKQGLSKEDIIIRYLGDDWEYEPWLSDLVSRYVIFLRARELLPSQKDLRLMKAKEMFKGIINQQLQEAPTQIQLRQSILLGAKQLGVSPREFMVKLKKAPSIHKFSVVRTKQLLTQPLGDNDLFQAFGLDGRNRASITVLLRLRNKEFAADFLKNFEFRMRKMMDEN
tara:strand:- start:317 stop:1483 length:1167 start_codon:yes stop_codon:yes gene_type:complete